MRVDNATLAIFKARTEMIGGNYQKLLRDFDSLAAIDYFPGDGNESAG
jgi:hypothetical protein